MYDIVAVGSGITVATLCALLKNTHKILVLEIRDHIGGNCYDRPDKGSFVHQYGPHIFHSPSQSVVDLLSKYTEWSPLNYSVQAEIEYECDIIRTPFPYSEMTNKIIGRPLTPEEVINLYFKGYSRKMWGKSWEHLPNTIKGRVPKDTKDKPIYFPDQFVAMPKHGFTRMIENMLDGVEVKTSVGPYEWETIPAKKVIYTGRMDWVRKPNDTHTISELHKLPLRYRTLDLKFAKDKETAPAPVLNFCHDRVSYTRKCWYSALTGGKSLVMSTETPREALLKEPTPYYPVPFDGNPEAAIELTKAIQAEWPNLIMTGRLGSYKYLDMFMAVGNGIKVAKNIIEGREDACT